MLPRRYSEEVNADAGATRRGPALLHPRSMVNGLSVVPGRQRDLPGALPAPIAAPSKTADEGCPVDTALAALFSHQEPSRPTLSRAWTFASSLPTPRVTSTSSPPTSTSSPTIPPVPSTSPSLPTWSTSSPPPTWSTSSPTNQSDPMKNPNPITPAPSPSLAAVVGLVSSPQPPDWLRASAPEVLRKPTPWSQRRWQCLNRKS